MHSSPTGIIRAVGSGGEATAVLATPRMPYTASANSAGGVQWKTIAT
jgi:hypothetical protein